MWKISGKWDKKWRRLLQTQCNVFFFLNHFPIGRTPRGFVHNNTVGREIHCVSHVYGFYIFYWEFNLIKLLNFHENHRFREIPRSLSLLFRARRSMYISRSKIINFSPISFMLAKERVSIHEKIIFKSYNFLRHFTHRIL